MHHTLAGKPLPHTRSVGESSESNNKMGGWLLSKLAVCLVLPLCSGGRYRRSGPWGPDVAWGSFCASRRPPECCAGRNDSCVVEIMGSVCYCDKFCSRTAKDCCPDYGITCQGIAPPVTKGTVVLPLKYYHHMYCI